MFEVYSNIWQSITLELFTRYNIIPNMAYCNIYSTNIVTFLTYEHYIVTF